MVATALLGGQASAGLPSLVWLEQTAPGKFERRTIDSNTPSHASLDVGDMDGDGKPEVAVGWFAVGREVGAWVDVWRNARK